MSAGTIGIAAPVTLTDEQRRIVEWADGPLVVIAGAGTGKTRVIVERVRHLLETRGELAWTGSGQAIPAQPGRHDPSFDGPLVPEQLLVLTYNVKAARELQERFEASLGPAVSSRIAVSNFHSFCHRVLAEHAAEAGLASRPDVLDGVGQVLLLRDLWPDLPLIYHTSSGGDGGWWLGQFVAFINRAKDELVSPDAVDAFARAEEEVFEARFGSLEEATARLRLPANLGVARTVRKAYARYRKEVRAEEGKAFALEPSDDIVWKDANREARRTVDGAGHARHINRFTDEERDEIEELTETYVADGAALEVIRFRELALVYRAYQEELRRRGALDFGEQIAAVIRLFRERPNVLRRYQRQFRYLLVDEFQDANVAQIELVEMLGRTPDRPDNVMVVGDDDQSIYRFRGASYAAFAELDRRFGRPPVHDPTAPPPGPPTRMRLERNHRSPGHVLTAANRLIARNEQRYEPDKRLHTEREDGLPVDVLVCAGPADEAVSIVDRLRALGGPASDGARPWSDIAILYRKHRHREAIVARLRDEDIPYTVVGGLSLFDTPEIRDLEQTLRAIADPEQDIALARMLTASPWQLDALEVLAVARMARYDRRHLAEAMREIVETGEVAARTDPETGDTGAAPADDGLQPATLDLLAELGEPPSAADAAAADADAAAPTAAPVSRRRRQAREPIKPVTRAKLRRVVAVIDELHPLTLREGPHTILERLLERTGTVLDLIAADTRESQRQAANVASFMRFAADWQQEHPRGSLASFVDYLDAYQAAGGELPTSVELTEDVDGVRLMTLYQAKGLEFPFVFVPYLLEDEWPVGRETAEPLPRELLRDAVPTGDLLTEEERRLLYVAMTRTQERLVMTTHQGPAVTKHPSVFIADLLDGAGPEIAHRTSAGVDLLAAGAEDGPDGFDGAGEADADGLLDAHAADAARTLRQVMPLPSAREHRLRLRIRASELLGLIEGADPADPETDDARRDLLEQLRVVGEAAGLKADEARARGLDPLTMREVALDSGAGSNLLEVAALPGHVSYSQLDVYEKCPLRYAFKHVYRFPEPPGRGATTFGSTAHEAFERFTREARERAARGEPPPTREDLGTWFAAAWQPGTYASQTAEEAYRARIAPMLDAFYDTELAAADRTVVAEELPFELVIEPGDGTEPIRIEGSVDRIDRLPSGGIEVIDYKTGKASSQSSVDKSLQLSIYALACRDALDLGTPELVTLYFTESQTRVSTARTDDELDAARADIVSRVARIRAGDFAATPGAACRWCDYRALCPSKVT